MDMKVVSLCACTRYIHYYKSEVEIYLQDFGESAHLQYKYRCIFGNEGIQF